MLKYLLLFLYYTSNVLSQLPIIQEETDYLEIRCLVCDQIMKEVQKSISKVNPSIKVNVGGYRLDSNSKQKTIEYRKSEGYLTELMENICEKMDNFVKAKHRDTGKIIVMPLVNENGQMNPLMSEVDVIQDDNLNKNLKLYCEEIIENYDEMIVESLQKNEDVDLLSGEICNLVCDTLVKEDYYGVSKKPCIITPKCSKVNEQNISCNIETTLLELKKTFKLHDNIPPIVLVHQFYSIIKCRTTVDKKINALQAEGKIRLFKFGIDECSLGVVLTNDLVEFLNRKYPSNPKIKKFVTSVIPVLRDVSVEKSLLKQKFKLTDHDISEFVNAGLLTVRSASSYWFSIPSIGDFIKAFVKGRKAVLRTIRKCKYNEILLPELKKRVLAKSVTLTMQFHIHDIIGAELVKCIETTSGTILRFVKMPSNTNKKK